MRTLTICLLLLLQQAFSLAQTPCSGGFAGSYPCNNIDLQSFTNKSTLGASGIANDIWGWTDPLDGKEYAILGLNNGTAFVDISNPVSPINLGFLPTHTSNSSWRDIKVIDNYAYIVSEAGGHGIQVFDLTRLRTVPSPPETFTADAHNGDIGSAHNIVALEETGYVIAVGAGAASGGLVFFDVNSDSSDGINGTPTNPVLAGTFSADGYTHDAMCFVYRGPDKAYIGQEICIAYNEDTNTIVDATDKSNITQISRTPYTGARYTHQGWITDDHRYMLVNDELDESNNGHNTRTYVFDISDLDAPIYMGYHQYPHGAIDHNLYIKGRYAYMSNYQSGLHILDIGNIATHTTGTSGLNLIANFDTYPANDNNGFDGTWSNYPYFKSGNVIVSGILEGLFIVKPNFPHYSFSFDDIANGVQRVCPDGTISFTLNIDDYNFPSNVNLSLSGLDPALTATLSSTSVAPGGTVTVNVTASDGTNPSCVGNFCVLLTGNAGDASSEQSIAIGIIVDDMLAGCSPGVTCPSCFDGIMNQDETGIDCGGVKCPACPSCSDGIMNGDETGIDCGGATCPACVGPCGSATYLNCNSTISDTNAGATSDIDGYPDAYGTAGFTGPEQIYTFTVGTSGTVTITLSGLSDDLDIFLYDACDPTGTVLDFSYDSGTSNENITINLAPGTYYLFVDGWGGATSSYNLSLSCPAGDCTDGIQNEDETGIDCGGASCPACPIYLSAKVFLQGAHNGTDLRNDLNTMMPTSEPYTALGYTHIGGGGGESTLLGIITTNNIVDWVVIELRDKTNPATIVATRSALLRSDGMVVSHLDGTSAVEFLGPIADDYYVAIRHRNHLGVMTNAAVPVN